MQRAGSNASVALAASFVWSAVFVGSSHVTSEAVVIGIALVNWSPSHPIAVKTYGDGGPLKNATNSTPRELRWHLVVRDISVPEFAVCTRQRAFDAFCELRYSISFSRLFEPTFRSSSYHGARMPEMRRRTTRRGPCHGLGGVSRTRMVPTSRPSEITSVCRADA